ncbi:hypothetical protein H6P81_020543 [Aristolochia fimbriata]|uniref:Uncharacterized protein n=1 Tax=Aristolochia fimbriata TaxID=158543 RepID=A0AAV7DUW3_ARIFI|nr:hypothetical protein H6P81_020543 [Aristolochia fimbriata]
MVQQENEARRLVNRTWPVYTLKDYYELSDRACHCYFMYTLWKFITWVKTSSHPSLSQGEGRRAGWSSQSRVFLNEEETPSWVPDSDANSAKTNTEQSKEKAEKIQEVTITRKMPWAVVLLFNSSSRENGGMIGEALLFVSASYAYKQRAHQML